MGVLGRDEFFWGAGYNRACFIEPIERVNCEMSDQPIDFNQHVRVPEEVLFREIDGESVILNLDSGDYHGLDEVGTRIWIVLQDSGTIAEAYAQLLSEYDVDGETLKSDLSELLGELRDSGLITIETL